MGIGRKYREQLLEEQHNEYISKKIHSDIPIWMEEELKDQEQKDKSEEVETDMYLLVSLIMFGICTVIGIIYFFHKH